LAPFFARWKGWSFAARVQTITAVQHAKPSSHSAVNQFLLAVHKLYFLLRYCLFGYVLPSTWLEKPRGGATFPATSDSSLVQPFVAPLLPCASLDWCRRARVRGAREAAPFLIALSCTASCVYWSANVTASPPPPFLIRPPTSSSRGTFLHLLSPNARGARLCYAAPNRVSSTR
jgi:hypothetical protein